MTPKDVEAIIDIENSNTGHLVRMVKKMINLALNKLSLKLTELGSNRGKANKLIII